MVSIICWLDVNVNDSIKWRIYAIKTLLLTNEVCGIQHPKPSHLLITVVVWTPDATAKALSSHLESINIS